MGAPAPMFEGHFELETLRTLGSLTFKLMRLLQSQAYASLERLLERDHDRIADESRTKVLHHGEVRPKAVVLFHGLCASPAQFARFSTDLHERGHNVVVPRLPRHGYRNRLSSAIARLTADDLRRAAEQSVEIAAGLGDEVTVAGFSLGGLLATWVALREPVERAVAIAPFFGVSWLPNRWMGPLATAALRMPNRYQWWNPILRERQQPPHGYPRYSTHAVAHAYRLAREVLDASDGPIHARRLVFVLNARETAVNNRATLQLAEALGVRSRERIEQIVLRDIPYVHDIVEPLRMPAIADRVYPRLLEAIEG